MSKMMIIGLMSGVCLLVLLLMMLLIIYIKAKKGNSNNKEFPELLKALGGKENITEASLNGSRISLKFIDKENLDKEKIKENGVESIVISNKKITLVIGKQAPNIYKYLSENTK